MEQIVQIKGIEFVTGISNVERKMQREDSDSNVATVIHHHPSIKAAGRHMQATGKLKRKRRVGQKPSSGRVSTTTP